MAQFKDILDEAKQELAAWQTKRREGKNRFPTLPYHQVKNQKMCRHCGQFWNDRHVCNPRVFLCRYRSGCDVRRWNRTKYCEAHYFKLRRHQQKPLKPVYEQKVCRCGKLAVAMGRCNICYGRYRRLNPKLCDCGRYYRNKGLRCGFCKSKAWIDRLPRCKCGRKASNRQGCANCARLKRAKEQGLYCACGELATGSKTQCLRCYSRDYHRTPKFRRARRMGMRRARDRKLKASVSFKNT